MFSLGSPLILQPYPRHRLRQTVASVLVSPQSTPGPTPDCLSRDTEQFAKLALAQASQARLLSLALFKSLIQELQGTKHAYLVAGTDGKPRDYSHHVVSQWRQHDEVLVWEVAIDIYTSEYVDGSPDNRPVNLQAGKVMGLMIAYCDNDGSELRENFIGSESVPSGPKDRGWIDAGLFGALELVESD